MNEFYCPICNKVAKLYGNAAPDGPIGFYCQDCGPHIRDHQLATWVKYDKLAVMLSQDAIQDLKAIHNIDPVKELKAVVEFEFKVMITGKWSFDE